MVDLEDDGDNESETETLFDVSFVGSTSDTILSGVDNKESDPLDDEVHYILGGKSLSGVNGNVGNELDDDEVEILD